MTAPDWGWVGVALAVFADESHDETKSRVFAIAALYGYEHEWKQAEAAWVARTGGAKFHAVECETEYAGHPDRSKHENNLRLYKDLTNVIAGSDLAGYGVALDIQAFANVFGVDDEIGYYKCFIEVVGEIVRLAHITDLLTIPGIEPYRPVEFVFDHHAETEYNAGLLYSRFVNWAEWKTGNKLLSSKISFDSRANPRIQMADLWAREVMKDLDNKLGPVKRVTRRSMAALLEAAGPLRFRCEHLDLEHSLKRREDVEHAISRDQLRSEYLMWLETFHLQDNWSNRIRFTSWRDNRERLA